uniref:FtsK/SpoIIIE domain-containing protein n=1 Tax=Pseudoclavibacter sp. RFBI5 TaxID=2080578 RepID=UPI0011B0F3DF|nr:FtsK/SpoIIIE domain-containing protein [Pseudoclavibacter sp. RFBI5]
MTMQRMPMTVGQKFDPTNPKHVDKVLSAIDPAQYGTGWKIEHYDQAAGKLYVTRQDAVTSVEAGTRKDEKVARLGPEYGPGDGEKAAKRFESIPDFAGYVMTHYDSYRAIAHLTKLSPDEIRCRDAIAIVVGAKPWEVQVSKRRGGGFHVRLPKTYTPSKHDAKLNEVVTTAVGLPGWYSKIDVPNLSMEIIPSKPPTFPGMVPYPLDRVRELNTQDRLLYGWSLPENGDDPGEYLWFDWGDGPHGLLQGTTSSGKTVSINGILTGALAAGMELAILDTPAKSVDFMWCRKFVRPGGWGCESSGHALAVLDGIYREGNRRAAIIKAHGVQNITQLPPDVRQGMPRILTLADEVAALIRPAEVIKGLDKEDPRYLKQQEEGMIRGLTKLLFLKLTAEMRFTGLHVLLSSQVMSQNTGFPTELRDNSSNRWLMGPGANDRQRNMAFNNPDSAPKFSDHPTLLQDKNAVRGTGVAELPGQPTRIFKGLYASTDDLSRRLVQLGVPTYPDEFSSPSYLEVQRAIHGDDVEVKRDLSGPPLANDPDAGATDQNGNRLTGAAAAAAASKRHAGV